MTEVGGLGRVRKQARAAACQANLRQWGLALHTYAAANDGKLTRTEPYWWTWWDFPWSMAHSRDCEAILLCPSARRPSDDGIPPGVDPGTVYSDWLGSPWRAWKTTWFYPHDRERTVTGSYGVNGHMATDHARQSKYPVAWQTIDAKGASDAPTFFDCAAHWFNTQAASPFYDGEVGLGLPPEYTDFFLKPRKDPATYWVCMDRHNGGINMCFLDSSVRKVGLKELWTLKWHRQYNTANRWTKAGGVQPKDWPKWMRRFKDY